MKSLQAFYLLVIILMGAAAIVYTSRNTGFDLGFQVGYNQAILDGKLEVVCKPTGGN